MSLIIKNEAADYGLGTNVGLRTGTLSCKPILHVNSIFAQFVTFDNYVLSPNHPPEVVYRGSFSPILWW